MMSHYDGESLDAQPSAAADETSRWAARQLRPEHRAFLGLFVETVVLSVAGLGEVLFCHATPFGDEPIMTVATPEGRVRELLAGIGPRVVVCGHTHMQYDRTVGAVRVVNAGSVGMPYGEPGAYWALLGPAVELRRTPYDFEAAAEQIRRTTYPLAADFAANNVLRPPSAAEALAYFERAAG
jgi:diadenosine tetraphosphatase ApaH/serine/threonine PP2A family protein phosphatase